MLKKRNKRGQFYLIAAIIIIAVIIGFAVLSTTPKKKVPVKLYDLGQELGVESQNVLAYGTYNELNETQMEDLLTNFTKEYASYAGEGRNLYFIFGNTHRIKVVAYQALEENVTVCQESGQCNNLNIIGGVGESRLGSSAGGSITLVIGGNTYSFNLATGENFYFVISQKIEGETYVIQG